MWRNDDKLWVQVMADGTCYGAHFLESEEGLGEAEPSHL